MNYNYYAQHTFPSTGLIKFSFLSTYPQVAIPIHRIL